MLAHPVATTRRLIFATLLLSTSTQAEIVFGDGFDPLASAPVVRIERDDRVATLEMDYDAENAWGQWWTMDGSGHDDAGFLVSWWPENLAPGEARARATE